MEIDVPMNLSPRRLRTRKRRPAWSREHRAHLWRLKALINRESSIDNDIVCGLAAVLAAAGVEPAPEPPLLPDWWSEELPTWPRLEGVDEATYNRITLLRSHNARVRGLRALDRLRKALAGGGRVLDCDWRIAAEQAIKLLSGEDSADA